MGVGRCTLLAAWGRGVYPPPADSRRPTADHSPPWPRLGPAASGQCASSRLPSREEMRARGLRVGRACHFRHFRHGSAMVAEDHRFLKVSKVATSGSALGASARRSRDTEANEHPQARPLPHCPTASLPRARKRKRGLGIRTPQSTGNAATAPGCGRPARGRRRRQGGGTAPGPPETAALGSRPPRRRRRRR